jgi:hypothetical protein
MIMWYKVKRICIEKWKKKLYFSEYFIRIVIKKLLMWYKKWKKWECFDVDCCWKKMKKWSE